jgi:Flp pilus assembly protein TadG
MSLRLKDERGASAVVLALVLVVLIGILALSINGGLLLSKYRQVRRASDAGALAAAISCQNQEPPDPTIAAVDNANQYSAANVDVDPTGPVAQPPRVRFKDLSGTLVFPQSCTGMSAGRVTVQYTVQQSLLFGSSPKYVSATATATWGFAGGGPIFPLTVSRNRLSTCGIPDSMTEADIGVTRCAFYFNQNTTVSTWGLIDLGTWGVSPTDANGCSAGVSSGNQQYVDWYNTQPILNLVHDNPASAPTFVCPTPGNRTVLYATDSNSQNAVVARAVASRKTYMFPVNQPGPCSAPVAPASPTCNTLTSNGSLDRYAVIGLAWLKPAEICGTGNPQNPGFDCTQSNSTGTTDKALCDALVTAATPADSNARCLVAEWEGFTTSTTDVVVGDSFGNVKIIRLVGN